MTSLHTQPFLTSQAAHFFPQDPIAIEAAYITNPQELAQRFSRYRAILIRGLLRTDYFVPIKQSVNRRLSLLESLHGLTSENRSDLPELSRRLMALSRHSAEAQKALYDQIGMSPELHSAACHPALIGAIEALLSPNIALHPRLILLMLEPQHRWHLAGWHQDWYYNQGPNRTLTAYIPLQKTSARNGGLQLALREYPWSLLPHGDFNPHSKWHVIDPSAVEQFDHIYSIDMVPGDILLFDSLVPHSPQLNQSNQVRFVANFRYQDLTEPAFLQNHWRIDSIDHAREAMKRTPNTKQSSADTERLS